MDEAASTGRPRRSYLVCATQRSGSTLLCEMLKETGVAGRPEEFFEATRDTGLPPHPGDYLAGLARTGVGIRDDPTPPEGPDYSSLSGIADYRVHLARTRRWGTTPNGVFGAKLMWNQVPELASLAGELPEYAGLEPAALLGRLFGGPRFIWVSRRDKVRQAVSLWKALQTRSWRQGGSRGGGPSLEYRFSGIKHLVDRLEADDRGWERFFSEHEIEALKIGYEDELEQDPAEATRRALAWIGIEPLPQTVLTRPALQRQADTTSEAWVAAYHRDASRARA